MFFVIRRISGTVLDERGELKTKRITENRQRFTIVSGPIKSHLSANTIEWKTGRGCLISRWCTIEKNKCMFLRHPQLKGGIWPLFEGSLSFITHPTIIYATLQKGFWVQTEFEERRRPPTNSDWSALTTGIKIEFADLIEFEANAK